MKFLVELNKKKYDYLLNEISSLVGEEYIAWRGVNAIVELVSVECAPEMISFLLLKYPNDIIVRKNRNPGWSE